MRILWIALAASSAMVAAMNGSAAAAVIPNVGSKADVAAVVAAQNKYWHSTRVLNDPFRIDGVHVVGDDALFQWYGEESAGFGVYKRVSGEVWKKIVIAGGAIGEDELAKYIASKSIAHQLCSGWPAHYSPC